jgi:small ligand-binding sensory domain FIST
MKWATAFSDKSHFEDNIQECILQLEQQLGGAPDILFYYSSPYFFDYAHEISATLSKVFPVAKLAGCGAAAKMAGLEELSDNTCISIMAGILPGVDIDVVHLDISKEPGADVSPQQWYEFTGVDRIKNQSFIVLADPYSANVEDVLKGLDYAYEATIVGGFSSGVQFKGGSTLFCNDDVYNNGMILVSLSGNIDVIPLVAQGCRPIGKSLTVTNCSEVVLEEVDHRNPMLCLKEIAEDLSEPDKVLLHQSLFIGVEMDNVSIDTNSEQYLIRNIRGINPESGALVVGDHLQEGQNVCFHIRDPESSRNELRSIADSLRVKLSNRECRGILVFSCLGRLADFYGEESVDASIINSIDDAAPLAGIFCSGEIGPVQSASYIHSYTASAALFFEPVK